jgi:hypothetical protein
MEVKQAQEASPHAGDSLVVCGPPGTGKSWFAGSVPEVEGAGPALLVATLPREVKSSKYQQHDLDYLLIHDPDWEPSKGGVAGAVGFCAFRDLMSELRDDEKYKTIIIDSGTELAEMAWHYAMVPHNVPSPALIEGDRNRFLPYETLGMYMIEAVLKAVNLTLPDVAVVPKNVIFTWHSRTPQDEQPSKGGGAKKSADQKKQDVEYEGKVLPAIRGQFRTNLMRYVSSFIWSDKRLRYEGIKVVGVDYLLQVQPDDERHCKVPGPVPAEKYVPNNFAAFKQFLDHQKELETKMTLDESGPSEIVGGLAF